ncbi:MAG: class I SAM-dependent methyltransferase [Methanimicrococcus sp.]|nr:class I SAM-dependent methyltransferase [Methanimicrococcus sp.]
MSFISKKDADAWDAEYSHVTWGGLSEYLWIQKNLPDNAFLLDAGSGTGRYLKKFFLKYTCIGIDLSKNALLRSIQDLENVAEKKGGLPLPDHFVSNVTTLPFKESCFDGILCLGVLQHLLFADRLKAISELHRVLKKGGCVYFEAFGESDMRCNGDLFPLTKPEERTFLRQNGIIYHYFKEEELKKLFEENGFITKEFQSLKREKKYDGESYIRHYYRAVFEK